MNSYEQNLHASVNAFRLWAKQNFPTVTEKTDNGEWCTGDEFDAMCDAAIELIKNIAAGSATEQMVDDLLYCIARNSEWGTMMNELEDNDEWFSLLCRKCLDTDYTNAKWQFAEHLPNYKGTDDIQKLVYEFLEDEDEYTERMALKTLADIYPDCAEEYAVEFWERDKYSADKFSDEYQKIMALCVLEQVHSEKLPHYLDLAKKSGYKYLCQNAEDIESRLKE